MVVQWIFYPLRPGGGKPRCAAPRQSGYFSCKKWRKTYETPSNPAAGNQLLLSLLLCLTLLPMTVLADDEPATPTVTADFITNPTTALALLNAAKTEGAADSK